jgi:hypothetical protein
MSFIEIFFTNPFVLNPCISFLNDMEPSPSLIRNDIEAPPSNYKKTVVITSGVIKLKVEI